MREQLEGEVVVIGTSAYVGRVERVLRARGFKARRLQEGRGLSAGLEGADAVVFEGSVDMATKLRALTDGCLVAVLRSSDEQEFRRLWESGVEECVAADLARPGFVPWVLKKALWERSAKAGQADGRKVASEKATREERRAMVDGLTGLYNRRHAEERLSMMLERGHREGKGVAIALFDIDRFKAINDDHGHDVGDEVLVGVAGCLSRELRPGDFVARWGGEEFIAGFYGVDEDGSRSLVQRLLDAVKRRAPAVELGERTVTASAGVCVAGDGMGLAEAVKRADAAMYRAKRSGRDRLVTADREENKAE